MSPTYLSHIEQGKVDTPPTADRVQKMAELLGETADELIAMAGRVPDDLPKIIQSQPEAMHRRQRRAAKGLTPAQMKKLLDQANKMGGKEGSQ